MSTISQLPGWPVDSGHCEAIDTLLVMAESEERWGDRRRALALLDHVERIVGALPQAYELIRSRCDGAVARSRAV